MKNEDYRKAYEERELDFSLATRPSTQTLERIATVTGTRLRITFEAADCQP